MTGSLHFKATAFAFVCCIVLGGGTRPGFLSDVIAQLVCIPLLCWSLWLLTGRALPKGGRVALALCAVCVAVPLLQLLPLPIRFWQGFAARGIETAVLDLVGASPSLLPTTVSVDATMLSALALIPPVAIFLSVLQLQATDRRLMTLLFLAAGVVSAFLGLAQLSQGPNSALRFFSVTNREDAVGFFANRNHFATLINCAIAFALGWTLDIASGSGNGGRAQTHWTLYLSLALTATIVLVAAILMARSRAGVLGTCIVFAGGAGLTLRGRRFDRAVTPGRILGGAVAFALLLGLQYSLYRLVDRFNVDPLRDARTDFARVTFEAIKAYFPFGSGVGTFTHVYPAFEKPQHALVDTFANRAHNDYLEFALEAGLAGGALVAAIGLFVIRQAWQAWTRLDAEARLLDATLVRSASIALAVIAFHSAVDYPLRTTAVMVVAALCLALLVEAPSVAPAHTGGERRSRAGSSPQVSRSQDEVIAWQPVPLPETLGPERNADRKSWGQDVDWPDEWRNGNATSKSDRKGQ